MRNFFLFITLIGLIAIVYIFDEKKNVQTTLEQQKRELIFDTKELGSILKIFGENLSLSFANNEIISGNELEISSRKIDLFFKNLEKINIVRIFTFDEIGQMQNFIPKARMKLTFEGTVVELELGEPLSFDTTFYLKIISNGAEKIALARYTGEILSQMTMDGSNSKLAGWQEVKRLFNQTERSLMVDNPFENLKIESVKIKILNNLEYLIDIANKTTFPKILNDLEYKIDIFEKYLNSLLQMKVISVEKISKKPDVQLAIVTIGSKEIEVYKKYLGRSGYFLKSENLIFEINGDDFRKLMTPYQSFWNKKLKFKHDVKVSIFNLKDELVVDVNLKNKNKWTDFLKEEAYTVNKKSKNLKKYTYKITQDNLSYFVFNSSEMSEVYDPKSNLLYQFLDKLE